MSILTGSRSFLSNHWLRRLPIQPNIRRRFVVFRHPCSRFSPIGQRRRSKFLIRLRHCRLRQLYSAARPIGSRSWSTLSHLTIQFTLLRSILLLSPEFQILLLLRFTETRPGRPTQNNPNHHTPPKPAPSITLLRQPNRNQRRPSPRPSPPRTPRVRPEHRGGNHYRLGDRNNPIRIPGLHGGSRRV